MFPRTLCRRGQLFEVELLRSEEFKSVAYGLVRAALGGAKGGIVGQSIRCVRRGSLYLYHLYPMMKPSIPVSRQIFHLI